MHAAEISRESIRLGSSIRGAREEMREREAWATWECKAGQKEGGERRLSLLPSCFVYVVDPSSYAHVTQLGRAGERRAVGSSTWARSSAHWQRWSVYCACHGGGGKGRRKGRREERRLTCSICLLNTTRPAHQGESERASERADEERAAVFAHQQNQRHASYRRGSRT